MARAPFNVLVIPYRLGAAGYEYAVFHRADCDMWQFIAGGGEGAEDPAGTARREAREEAGLDRPEGWMRLDSEASIPRTAFPDAPWPKTVFVIPEHCFAVEMGPSAVRLSHEHDLFRWLPYDEAHDRLTWDSNRVALGELRERLRAGRERER